MRRGAMAATVAVLAGCAGDPKPAPVGPPWVELGTGVAEFVALDDGDTLTIVRGIQGGYMVPVSLRAGGLWPGDEDSVDDPDNPHVDYRLIDPATDAAVATAIRDRGFTCVDDRSYELVGVWVLFDLTLDTADFFDRDLRLEVDVTDLEGTTAAAGVQVHAAAPVDD